MKPTRVLGASLAGTEAELVTVEARFQPKEREAVEITLSGLPDPIIRESKGRLLCALQESGLRLPNGRLYLNLVPAARPKSGAMLDLALVLGAAGACGHIERGRLKERLFLGEVGIDGSLHAVPGGFAAGMLARDNRITQVIAPEATAREAACLPGLDVRSARSVVDAVRHLVDPSRALARASAAIADVSTATSERSLDDVVGQAAAKRALIVAAAGGHGLLFVGPPGAGKSMLAQRLIGLLPYPTLEEQLELTRVVSALGRWPHGLVATRPFRAPHYSASHAGLIGGGSPPLPGEITLAHHGVLFLDELPEFRRDVLESVRQPLESGSVLISRAGRQVEWPASFQLVCAMNPCPCGHYGYERVPCTCTTNQVLRYQRRISGPLLDRIDLRVEMQPPTPASLMQSAATPGAREANERARETIDRAQARRSARGQPCINAALPAGQLADWAPLDQAARQALERFADRRAYSARAVQSVRRVARTIADLDDVDTIAVEHIGQAVALRAPLGADYS